ncbi:MAG: 6-phosphofructokinase [Thermoplasmatota archaeon]
MHIGILCGGGPAPGFNGVIHGVTVAAAKRGWTVTGLLDGYKHLMVGEPQTLPLTPSVVAGISTRGGSIIRTNRANPKKSPETMANVVAAVKALGLDALVTLGGDDTATSAANVAEALAAEGVDLRVAHVPKTIDNDLPLPGMAPTFGYTTAAHLGAELCRNLREDALTTARWYLVSAMGRSAGHLSLAMASGSEADVCIIREEFDEDEPIRMAQLADLVEHAITSRAAAGQVGGLVVLAEGLLERLHSDDLAAIGELELDEHGNPRMSEIDLGRAVRDAVAPRVDTAFVTKIIGYELRCADPVAFDVQYTTSLGAAAVAFLAEGVGHGLMAQMDGHSMVLRFEELRDKETGRIPVRRVDVDGAAWQASLALQARA